MARTDDKSRHSYGRQLVASYQERCDTKQTRSHYGEERLKDIVKKVKDYLKTYLSAEIDTSCWKDRFLVYLDGLEPCLLEILENGPYVPKSHASTPENVLIKPQKQWSPEDIKLANQDKRLKIIIISCLPNDIMKSVIKAPLLTLEGEKVQQTFTMLKILLNVHENEDVKIPQAENDNLATLFGKYNYEEELLDQIHKSETNTFTI
ncbi:hypothetical protein Tco_0364848 [Tanacetum coccineum]